MPLDLAALQRKSATVTVEYEDEEFSVDYLPHRLTGRMNRLIVEATSDPELSSMDEAILQMVKSWELTDGRRALPITKEVVTDLPIMLKLRICNAIVGDVTDPLRGRASRAGSSPEILS